jgi:hypothetical protein
MMEEGTMVNDESEGMMKTPSHAASYRPFSTANHMTI